MNITIAEKRKKELFISIFQLLKNSTTNVNATFNKDAMFIQGMDKSHVCLFDLELDKEWFSEYIVDEQTNICFDANIFYSMISTKSEEQKLVIKQISDDVLSIDFINIGKKSEYDKYFTIPLIEYEYDKMNIPDIEYDAEFSLTSKKITDMFGQLSNFGNDLNIKCFDDFVDFSTKDTSGEMRVNIPLDEMTSYSYSVIKGDEIILNYSLIYISKMCITNKLSTDIEFYLSNDCPMKIRYDLQDYSSLLFYIAPKVSDD